jgi:hypothetical protein
MYKIARLIAFYRVEVREFTGTDTCHWKVFNYRHSIKKFKRNYQ